MEKLGLGPAPRFFIFGIITLGVSACVVWILPDFLIRFCRTDRHRLIYKLDVVGAENIPTEGGAASRVQSRLLFRYGSSDVNAAAADSIPDGAQPLS